LVGVAMQMFGRGRSKIKTGDNLKIKDGLKIIDDMKNSLTILSDSLRNYVKRGRLCYQEESALSSTIRSFSDKEKEVPVPYQSGDSCFVLAMEKFSELIQDVSILEVEFMEEIDNIIEQIQSWVRQELQEKTKVFKKSFDSAKSEYEKCLGKVGQHQQQKVIPITKLYLAELELAKAKHEYEEATYLLETHCDDIQHKVNFFLLEQLIRWYNSQKKLMGYCYGYLDDTKEYLKDLRNWSREEEDLFLSHAQNRIEKRDIIHNDQELKYVTDFVDTLTNFELVQAISKAISADVPESSFLPLFVVLFRHYNRDIPGAFSAHVSGVDVSETGESALRKIQGVIRENFDSIGNQLMEDGKKDSLVLLGQVLASLEKEKQE